LWIIQSLVEGEVEIDDDDWPKTNNILIILALSLTSLNLIAIIWLVYKVRVLGGAILLAKNLSTVHAFTLQYSVKTSIISQVSPVVFSKHTLVFLGGILKYLYNKRIVAVNENKVKTNTIWSHFMFSVKIADQEGDAVVVGIVFWRVKVWTVYEHKMANIFADDSKYSLSLRKMANRAKKDQVIFSNLAVISWGRSRNRWWRLAKNKWYFEFFTRNTPKISRLPRLGAIF
jgi:hypothetical protein